MIKEQTVFTWLIEARGGKHDGAAAIYWAGQHNRVGDDPRGVLVTFNPNKARRIPDKGLADDIAVALDKAYPASTKWAAVEHGFITRVEVHDGGSHYPDVGCRAVAGTEGQGT